MRIVFAGTGGFGVPALRLLVQEGEDVVLAISQPDRPAGRRKELKPPEFAVAASELALELFQPERINRPEARERVAAARPDVLVVVSYGQILRPKLLAMPRLGCVNLHGSLLPRHRGASPIQAAILAGDSESGNTVMLMNAGMDTGPMLIQESTPLAPDETAGSLHDRLAAAGAPLLVRALRGLAAGTLVPRPQDDSQATHCGLITKEDAHFDWTLPAAVLERRLRALTPWPGAFSVIAHRERPLRLVIEAVQVVSTAHSAVPGTIVAASDHGLIVACGVDALRVLRVKPAGKRSLGVDAFLRGYPLAAGACFAPV